MHGGPGVCGKSVSPNSARFRPPPPSRDHRKTYCARTCNAASHNGAHSREFHHVWSYLLSRSKYFHHIGPNRKYHRVG
ncbi:unnamed protein product [Ectocarpus sp. 6 AP-2014]